MMEEKYLIEKVGRENPFRVPEGYFDTLSSQIMAKVEAEGVAPRDIKTGRKNALKPCGSGQYFMPLPVCVHCSSVLSPISLTQTKASLHLLKMSWPIIR